MSLSTKKKQVILRSRKQLFSEDVLSLPERDGVELEKGTVLTIPYLEEHKDSIENWLAFFCAYPDCFLDLIKPTDSGFDLFFYQRITLRALMRFKDVYVTAPRAFSKSFLTILALFLQCVFIPGRKVFICANTKQQAAQITRSCDLTS